MNKETFNKISDLIHNIKAIDDFLKPKKAKLFKIVKHPYKMYNQENDDTDGKVMTIDRETLEPMLIACRDKMKAELKELGYEE